MTQNEYVDNPTFTQWLYFQPKRKHALIATFVEANRRHWPSRARSLSALLRFVDTMCSNMTGEYEPMEKALRRAYMAFERDIEAGVKIPRRAGPEALPDNKRRVLKSYSLAPATDGKIIKLQRAMKLPAKGLVIDALVDAADAKRVKKAAAAK